MEREWLDLPTTEAIKQNFNVAMPLRVSEFPRTLHAKKRGPSVGTSFLKSNFDLLQNCLDGCAPGITNFQVLPGAT